MTYLVTGAAGFLGGAIVDALLARGRQVVATDITMPADGTKRATTAPGQLESFAFDVIDRPIPPTLHRDYKAIIHAAALTGTSDPERVAGERLVEVNVGGTANLLELAKATQTPDFVYVSSSAVYRRSLDGPLRESYADGGDVAYGASKFAAEKLVIRECARAGIRPTIVRPCSLYGSGEAFRDSRPVLSPIWHLAVAALTRRTVLLTRPSSRREWLSVNDAAAAIATAAGAPGTGTARVLNVGSGTLTELRAVAAFLALRVMEDGLAESIVDGGEDWAGYLDTTAIRVELGWAPNLSLESGLAAYMRELTEAAQAAERAPIGRSGFGQSG